MKIILQDYKVGIPTCVHQEYDPKALDIEFVDLKYTKPLSMDGTVEKSIDTAVFRGHLRTEMEQTCGRCLKAVHAPVDQSFELFYEIEGKTEIETLDDLREILILDHPITFVCSEDCRGLCPKCGGNRNITPCDCEKNTGTNSTSSLNQWFIPKKEEKRNA